MHECGCDQCRYIEQQIVLAEKFNRWMARGFVCMGVLFFGFILGALFGWW